MRRKEKACVGLCLLAREELGSSSCSKENFFVQMCFYEGGFHLFLKVFSFFN